MMSTSKVTDKAIYGNYRNALKSYRKNSENTRAGGRKQDALFVTAARYKVPVSYVKNVVARLDAEAGITHEHDEGYLREMAFLKIAEKAAIELTEAQIAERGHVYCVNCEADQEDDLVRERPVVSDLLDNNHLSFTMQCFPCWFRSVPETTDYHSSNAEFVTLLKNWDYKVQGV